TLRLRNALALLLTVVDDEDADSLGRLRAPRITPVQQRVKVGSVVSLVMVVDHRKLPAVHVDKPVCYGQLSKIEVVHQDDGRVERAQVGQNLLRLRIG